MSQLKDLKVRVSIDGIGLSCKNGNSDDAYVGNVLGGYKRLDCMNLESHRPVNNFGGIDKRGINYKWLFRYKHETTNNILTVNAQRLFNRPYIPHVYAFFYSSYDQPLNSIDVQYVLGDLHPKSRKCLHLSKIHLAADLITPNRSNLFERVCRSINPLKKRQISVYESTLYLGSTRSPNQVVLYDKREQLKDQDEILIEGDICRIETRMKLSQLDNRISTIDELRCEGWASFIYGKYFSLDRPRHSLKILIGEKKAKLPIHKIKSTLRYRNGELPNNFHRDYIREHRIFGPAVRKALDSYTWI